MKKFLKSEKGSVAVIVTVTVLFFLTVLSTSYFMIATMRKSQLKSDLITKQVYENELNNTNNIYADSKKIVDKNTVSKSNATINGEPGSAYNPVIPKGYKPLDTTTASWGDGKTVPTIAAVEHGLVIEDANHNEWVWVPVPDINVICNTGNTTEYTLYGTSSSNAVKTKLFSKSGIISGVNRTTPGTTTGYREPDLVQSYDTSSTGYAKITKANGAKATSAKELAELFKNEYSEMIESIRKYKGFYIGRYELSSVGVQKNKATLTNTSWYDLYEKCKTIKASENVKTSMVWGCQWDATCKFISEKGDKKSITNSSSWGNYKEAVSPANTGAGSKKNTGTNDYWRANNIYDLAGNCDEWTQEGGTQYRAYRGGAYTDKGTGTGSGEFSVSHINYRNTTSTDATIMVHATTRPTLIIK